MADFPECACARLLSCDHKQNTKNGKNMGAELVALALLHALLLFYRNILSIFDLPSLKLSAYDEATHIHR